METMKAHCDKSSCGNCDLLKFCELYFECGFKPILKNSVANKYLQTERAVILAATRKLIK